MRYERESLELPVELKSRIVEAIRGVNQAGQYRTAPNRFYRDTSVAERNAFTKCVVDDVKWLNSKEGRERAAEKGHHLQSVLHDVIDIALDQAMEAGMSPIQVLYFGIHRTMSVVNGFTPDLELVCDFLATLLAEGERQHREKMVTVRYRRPSTEKLEMLIGWYLSKVETEYWLEGKTNSETAEVLFCDATAASEFVLILNGLNIENVERVEGGGR
jgi:hypothetical protein